LADDASGPVARNAAANANRLAVDLARGVGRMLGDLGYATLTEFTLRSGRRVDLIGLDAKGRVVIVEIKSSLEDFRSDRKWSEYLDYCDAFYFAVPEIFPQSVIPEDVGLIVADPFGAALLRTSPDLTLNASRRRSLLLGFARAAAQRLETHLGGY
jgi:hypothetical protein